MFVARMIYYQIQYQPHTSRIAGINERFHICDGTVGWVDGFVVGDIVAHVVLRRVVHRGHPDDIDAEIFDVVDFGDDAGYVT